MFESMVLNPLTALRRTADADRTVRIADLVEPSSHSLPPEDRTRPFWPLQRIEVAGESLTVRRTPGAHADGEPALYVHGLGGASTNFTDLAAALAPWFDGEAIDLPGHGHSAAPRDGVYSIGRFAKVVTGRIEQTGRGPVHLVGNSMGGAVAIAVAHARPDLVRTLTLVSPAAPDLHPRRLAQPLAPLMLVPGVGGLLQDRMRRYPAETRARAMLKMVFGDPSKVPPERVAMSAAEIAARDGMPWADDALVRSMKALVRWWLTPGQASPWRLMNQLQVPTLIVWGELDRLVDVSLAPRVARTIPGARLLVLPGVGHVAQMEEPNLVARAILAVRERAVTGAGQSDVGT